MGGFILSILVFLLHVFFYGLFVLNIFELKIYNTEILKISFNESDQKEEIWYEMIITTKMIKIIKFVCDGSVFKNVLYSAKKKFNSGVWKLIRYKKLCSHLI